MNYTLSKSSDKEGLAEKSSVFGVLKKLLPLLLFEKTILIISFIAIAVSSALTIWAPILIGHTVDTYLITKDWNGVVHYSLILLGVYAVLWVANFFQTRLMGEVGQRVLFRLRNMVFAKLEELPIAFFNQNKAGDLISRINNDTDKLNQFFSRSLMQFVGNIFVIIGAAIAMLVEQPRLGGAALIPAVLLFIFISLTTSWIKRRNFESLQALGGLSGEIQESLDNFKVIIAFNRRDYFRKRFTEANLVNYQSAVSAGVANNTYPSIFGLCSSVGQLIVIVYGLSLVENHLLTLGILISYIAYVSRFYDPLRQMAQLWSDLQTALAGWDRISEITNLESNLTIIEADKTADTSVLAFKDVSFGYPGGSAVLKDISFALEAGKTYALVGPTGGGKTTTASLMARLFDPTKGQVLLDGKDIRSYTAEERTQKIGFILQDPFLFSGTLRENLLYGNNDIEPANLDAIVKKEGFADLLSRFENGLDTVVASSGESISLGQRQLIAFIRAILRQPSLLILDEASANIDTVTEQLLDKVLHKLSSKTTKVIIAHRLNTIESADEIFFVNSGTISPAGSLEQAVAMLKQQSRKS